MGIGASAGGLEAFSQLLRALPARTGMAFVLVQHLDPRHESHLTDVLGRTTEMPVVTVTDGVRAQPDHVYVIPENASMTVSDGQLKLAPRDANAQHMPVDAFLLSLAEVRGQSAIGVVLSGSGSDGTLGLKAVKAEGGITFAQDERSARYPSMPQSASAFADLVLPPAGIARELARLGGHPYVSQPPPDRGDGEDAPHGATDVGAVVRALHSVTGLDLAGYKPGSVRRRIARRMAVGKVADARAYARQVREDPREAQALYDDVLIGVTGFFREPESFGALERAVYPKLLDGRPADDPIRIWVPGCSSGEEAYSIAISLREFLAQRGSDLEVRIFATDISAAAIGRARQGRYPESVAGEFPAERLERSFVRVPGGYQVRKDIRDMCTFAPQDLTKDPPFSRLDLISCCNLLIYLGAKLQERIIPVFHYALRPGGFLRLGPSEGIGGAAELFGVVDKKHKIYVRRPGQAAHLGFSLTDPGRTPARAERPGAAGAAAPARGESVESAADRAVLERHAPAGVVVDADMRIVQFRGRTGAYLEAQSGAASLDLFAMAREGLRSGIRAAVRRAAKTGAAARTADLRLRSDGRTHDVAVEVVPIGAADEPRGAHYLVLFEERAPASVQPAAEASRARGGAARTAADRRVVELTRDVDAAHAELQATVEEHEAAMEELRAATEEVQSSNEELQSTNEELETAQEELQATNEELTTVNDELNVRNVELAELSDDLANVLASIHVPIVLVGTDRRVRRTTPVTERALGLPASDVGRPLGDLRLSAEVPELEAALKDVAETLMPHEREIRLRDGSWASLRIRPYRTADDRIGGAVISFVDVDALKRAERTAKAAQDEAEATFGTVRGPLLILDPGLRVRKANASFYETFAVRPAETEGRLVYELGNGQWDIPRLRELLEEILPRASSLEDFEVEHEFETIGRRTMMLNARRVLTEEGAPELILLAVEDVTGARALEAARAELAASETALRREAETASVAKDRFLAVLSHELRTPLQAILGWMRLLRSGRLDGPHTTQGLDAIERNTLLQVRLISDLLDVSRIVMGTLRLEARTFMPALTVKAAVSAFHPAADAKDVRLQTAIDPAAGPVRGDPERLQQAVGNLLANAVKFTPSGGQVQVGLARRDSGVEIVVRDTGAGIAPSELPAIFRDFGDAAPPRRSGSGLGIGLGLARHLVERQGGALRAESAGPGHGATFTITLPIADDAPAPGPPTREPAAPARSAAPRQGLEGVRVLLVEDDADTQDVLREIIEEEGAVVTVALDVDAALAALERERPDVLVSDLTMPGQDGYALIHRLRADDLPDGAPVPALALTAYAGSGIRERVLAAGYQEYAVKPIEPGALVAVIRRLAGGTRGPTGA